MVEEGQMADPETFVLESLIVDAVESPKAMPYPTATVLMKLDKEENLNTFKLDTGSQANVISEKN